jgi:hypothetical protein
MQDKLKEALETNISQISNGLNGFKSLMDAMINNLPENQQKEVSEKLKEANFEKHLAKAQREFDKAKSKLNV